MILESCCSMKTNNTFQNQVFGMPISSHLYLPDPASKCHLSTSLNTYSTLKQGKVDSVFKRMNQLGRKADNFARGVKEHVRLGSNISKTVKGKFSLGAKILQVGGLDKIFKQMFRVEEDEKLSKVSQCYLSTTAGPIAGLLFISSCKVGFCSERSVKFSSANGESIRFHYKVVIPLGKVERVNKSENMKNSSQKYMQIFTVDGFDFWFMGFLNYRKTFKYLQQAISHNNIDY